MPKLPDNNQDPLLNTILQRLSFAEKEAVGKYHIYVKIRPAIRAASRRRLRQRRRSNWERSRARQTFINKSPRP